ncbi:MAG: FkbM family methyltransferase [Ginsengibacter sp.]
MLRNLKKAIKKLVFPDLTFKLCKRAGKLKKLGSSYGGWMVPVDYLSKDSICYMAGAGEDISFDCEVAKRFHCQVAIFDPTPRSKTHFDLVVKASQSMAILPVNNNPKELYDLDKESFTSITFYEIGLWKNTEYLKFFSPKNTSHISHSIGNLQNTSAFFMAPVKRLSKIMSENDHNKLDLLKLDIEGAEFEVIDSILEDKVDVKILCIEFHLIEKEGLQKIQLAINKLEENNFVVIAREGFDFTLINKSYLK